MLRSVAQLGETSCFPMDIPKESWYLPMRIAKENGVRD